MSSKDKKEYGELEQSMWRRFQDAEAMPGPDVWSRIDHALAMQESEKYKKRALYYRQLAAACFILFILAGSALVLHFKQDKEEAMLAAAGQQPALNAPVSSEATIAGTGKIAPQSNEPGISEASELPANGRPVGAEEASGLFNGSERRLLAAVPANRNYTSGRATVAAGATKQENAAPGLIAVATDESGRVETGIAGATQAQSYVPAGQAIVNVPDSYTSPASTNSLLLRNASLGTLASENAAQESINLKKQAEQSLALNTPTEKEKDEAARTNSRWNVGMGYSSAYFSQNINIPGYTVTPMTIMRDPDAGRKEPPKPLISYDSEVNMKAAREEFQENTQAAMSYNVDVKAGFRLGKRLKLLSGLGYSQNTSKTKTSYIVEQFIFNPRTEERTKLKPTTVFLPSLHTFTTDSVSVVRTKQPFDVDYSYQMLSVPLGLQFEGTLGQKWYWYAAGGMAANFLMQTSITAANPEIASVTYGPADDSPFRKLQFSGNVSMGVGKHLSDALNVSIGPEYRTFMNSMLTDDKAVATQGRPYTIGLNMGINYTLGHNSK